MAQMGVKLKAGSFWGGDEINFIALQALTSYVDQNVVLLTRIKTSSF